MNTSFSFFFAAFLFCFSASALDIYVDPSSVSQPWGETEGLLQFRGNPTRTWYGQGPLADAYDIAWRYPKKGMCGTSDGKSWCGSGWTGQPAIWKRPDGKIEIVVGTYDKSVHFIDFETGEALRKPFKTGDIIKGSVTIDPNGFPLVYFGSRDNKYRILSLQDEQAKELWALDAKDGVPYTIWNNDWDGNASVVNDHLIFGGENGWFYVWKLNRQVSAQGEVTVTPEIQVRIPGWNKELLQKIGDRNASIESSVAMFENRVYMTNSGGRVLGVDLKNVVDLVPETVFDFWMGDDVDASPVVDENGHLYIAAEYERFLKQAQTVGQLVKLNPYDTENPIVWSVDVRTGSKTVGGLWATPALGKDVIYASTHKGDLLTVDKNTGEVLSELSIGFHAWSSPIVIGNRLLVGTCSPGGFKIYDVENPGDPQELSHLKLQSRGCIESTPAVWNGHIVVGSRDGFIYKFKPQ
jgi:WD40 repeat protein